MLDVGCGALRGGLHFVRYLEPARYHGIDINPSLIRAGLWELRRAGHEEKCPPANLRATGEFESDFGVEFDFGLAQSLFTHIPLAQVDVCLRRLAPAMKSGARFFASYNGLPPGGKLSRRRPAIRSATRSTTSPPPGPRRLVGPLHRRLGPSARHEDDRVPAHLKRP